MWFFLVYVMVMLALAVGIGLYRMFTGE